MTMVWGLQMNDPIPDSDAYAGNDTSKRYQYWNRVVKPT